MQYASALERLVMRRYVVRFLVAVLTFGLGVALTLVFGLFKFSDTKSVHRQFSPRDCPKRFRVARPAFLTVDTQSTDPLRLVYVGSPNGDDQRMRFAVGNSSDKTISSYWIIAREIWKTNGESKGKNLEWTAFEVLEPGATSTISLPRSADGSSLRVAKVTFQDGSTWTNPRVLQ